MNGEQHEIFFDSRPTENAAWPLAWSAGSDFVGLRDRTTATRYFSADGNGEDGGMLTMFIKPQDTRPSEAMCDEFNLDLQGVDESWGLISCKNPLLKAANQACWRMVV